MKCQFPMGGASCFFYTNGDCMAGFSPEEIIANRHLICWQTDEGKALLREYYKGKELRKKGLINEMDQYRRTEA